VCVESKTAECTKKDPCKIQAIGAKFLSSRRIYSQVFRHRNNCYHYAKRFDYLCPSGSFCARTLWWTCRRILREQRYTYSWPNSWWRSCDGRVAGEINHCFCHLGTQTRDMFQYLCRWRVHVMTLWSRRVCYPRARCYWNHTCKCYLIMSQYWSVEQYRGLKSTMIGRSWMSMYLFFSLVLSDYESRFLTQFSPIITFEFRSVLGVF
jgi:hypothetical protein